MTRQYWEVADALRIINVNERGTPTVENAHLAVSLQIRDLLRHILNRMDSLSEDGIHDMIRNLSDELRHRRDRKSKTPERKRVRRK